MENDFLDRNQLMGADKDYGFDKVLRGYDIKQVEAYIENLLNSTKNASAMFDSRFNDLKNENAMLEFELSQVKGELLQAKQLFEKCRDERDKLKNEQRNEAAGACVVNSSEYKELAERNEKLIMKNRLLAEENKKLSDANRDMQRDIAHLTKKVDKNRAEINNLNQQIENGLTSDIQAKSLEIAAIYESAVDKAEDLIYRMQTELSLAHSKAEDIKNADKQ